MTTFRDVTRAPHRRGGVPSSVWYPARPANTGPSTASGGLVILRGCDGEEVELFAVYGAQAGEHGLFHGLA